jgi:hypothetical protein
VDYLKTALYAAGGWLLYEMLRGGNAMARPTGLVKFGSLAGVDVHWGTMSKTGTRELMPTFLAELEAAFEEIWRWCPHGQADAIVSAGAFVDRDGGPGDRHAAGAAFDLVSIYWVGRPPLVASFAQKDPHRYLAVEASLRRHCAQVLDYWYNSAHQSHFHIDDREAARGFSTASRADVVFVQAVCKHILSRDVEIDGAWGSRTAAAVGDWMGLGWLGWLENVAHLGWAF